MTDSNSSSSGVHFIHDLDAGSNPQDATVTVRLIKSFEFKNFRNVVFHHLDLTKVTLSQLQEMTQQRIRENVVLSRLFSTCPLDTFKLYAQAHGAKTNNPIINVGDDGHLVLKNYEVALHELGFHHETEVSWFEMASYEKYRQDPQFKWE